MPSLLTILMRAAHLLAASVWVGGSVVYLLAILPGLRLARAPAETAAALAALFRRLVHVCIGVVLVSGVYLVFDRLASPTAGTAYVVVLAVKTAAALAMIALALYQAQEARRLAKLRGRLWRVAPRWILALGIVTLVLGAALTGIFEAGMGQ